MSVETHSAAASEPTNGLLTDPRFELMPFESFEGQMEYLPEGATIAITTSPQLGLDALNRFADHSQIDG
jgi:methylenetetrahydrofolate reductase (NADPH)